MLLNICIHKTPRKMSGECITKKNRISVMPFIIKSKISFILIHIFGAFFDKALQ